MLLYTLNCDSKMLLCDFHALGFKTYPPLRPRHRSGLKLISF